MASGGNRHMATSRSHNHPYRTRGGGRGLSKADREARANAIHNRGDIMNPAEQKRQATLKEELGELTAATAEEFKAMDRRLQRAGEQIATLYRDLKQERREREAVHRLLTLTQATLDMHLQQGWKAWARRQWTRLRDLYTADF